MASITRKHSLSKVLYDIEAEFEVITVMLEKADISVIGLFLNADVGFFSR